MPMNLWFCSTQRTFEPFSSVTDSIKMRNMAGKTHIRLRELYGCILMENFDTDLVVWPEAYSGMSCEWWFGGDLA
jgi:hypothetical protein